MRGHVVRPRVWAQRLGAAAWTAPRVGALGGPRRSAHTGECHLQLLLAPDLAVWLMSIRAWASVELEALMSYFYTLS